MIDTNMLYKNSSDALMQARNSQSQILQKEFELKLMEINNHYSPYNTNNPYMNFIIQKHSIESEITRLKNERDNHVLNAISNALLLANIEMQSNIMFSMAYLAISSINSFLSYENVSSLSLPFTLQSDISQLSTRLTSSDFNPSLLSEIQRLKNIFHIY